MSLATRCTRCGTTFRVVQDQLKVSEGWVRCGRCAEVFNALEGLFDLEREGTVSAPMPLQPLEASEPAPAAAPALTPMPPAPPPVRASDDAHETAAIEPAALQASEDAAARQTPTMSDDAGDAGDGNDEPVDTRVDTRSDDDVDAGYQPLPFERVGAGDDDEPYAGPDTHAQLDTSFDNDTQRRGAADDEDDLQDDDHAAHVSELLAPQAQAPIPGFVRAADSAAQWDRPRVRASLWVAAGLLGLVLTVQCAVRQRDLLAAQWPQAAPALAALCQVLGCTIEAPRRIDALAVESSGLVRVDGSTLYRLQIVLRNREPALPVMVPAFDLTLTDLRNETIARRVLGARDFAAGAKDRLAPGAELQLAAVLDLGERRVAGYTVELFYP